MDGIYGHDDAIYYSFLKLLKLLRLTKQKKGVFKLSHPEYYPLDDLVLSYESQKYSFAKYTIPSTQLLTMCEICKS